MKSYFICTNCAFIKRKENMENHYNQCLDKSIQLSRLFLVQYKGIDHEKRDLIVLKWESLLKKEEAFNKLSEFDF
ncbi:hypothetical protein HYV49_05295 [Candidatus Pacearchaeota archaeon]|nr:hypothetical protein [Candidatus Pacearchaeota archaeon]